MPETGMESSFHPASVRSNYEALVLIGIDYLGEYYIGACLADWATGEPVPGGCDSYKVIIGPYEKREKTLITRYSEIQRLFTWSPSSLGDPTIRYGPLKPGTESEHLVLTSTISLRMLPTRPARIPN